jgi:hypothetical protein
MPITRKGNGQMSRKGQTFIEPTRSSYCVDLLRTFLGIEVWKQVRDFPNFNVSNFGNVQHFRDGIVRNKHLRKGGYYQVSMGRKNVDIHAIVCKTFIPECDYIGKNLSVDHINRNRTCNILTNLRWETRQGQRENQSYPETHSKTRPIWRCKLDGTKIDRYSGSKDAAKKLFDEISHNHTTVDSMASRISEACRGVKNIDDLFGYKWCFDEEVNASLPGEVWKDIPVCILGDPKHEYEASTEGRVRTKRNKLIMNGHRVEGYNRYSIAQKNKQPLTVRGNQIIATTFIPNPDNLPIVDHKNEIRHDDSVENLRWATHQQNAEYHHQINDSTWSDDHEQLLMDACKQAMVGDKIVWEQFIVPDEISHRTLIAIKGRYYEILKRDPLHNRGRNHWTEEEEQILKEAYEKALVKEVSWNKFTKPSILEHRTLDAIQSRYRKHLHNEVLRYPGRGKTSWTREEDEALIEACKKAYVQFIKWDKFQIPNKLKHRSKIAIRAHWRSVQKSLIDNPKKHKLS